MKCKETDDLICTYVHYAETQSWLCWSLQTFLITPEHQTVLFLAKQILYFSPYFLAISLEKKEHFDSHTCHTYKDA